jgi:hypothetical protein
VAVHDCLFNTFNIFATLHTEGHNLHPQTKNTPCCGDRDHKTCTYVTIQNKSNATGICVQIPALQLLKRKEKEKEKNRTEHELTEKYAFRI